MASKTLPLEKAAKYLCTVLDGRCPMAIESYPCPTDCTVETVPWHCWVIYFQDLGTIKEEGFKT